MFWWTYITPYMLGHLEVMSYDPVWYIPDAAITMRWTAPCDWQYTGRLRICLIVVCLGFNVWGHIATMPACSSGTLTNVLPLRNAMPQTQNMTPHPVTDKGPACRCAIHWWGMSHWNTQLPILFNVLGQTRPEYHSPTFHLHMRTLNFMMLVVSQKLGRKYSVPTGSWTRDLWCANLLRWALAHKH